MERCFRYALIRVVPDPGRGEVLNVGMSTLGDQGEVRVHMLPSFGKVEVVNAAFDVSALASVPKLVQRWSDLIWNGDEPAQLGPVVVEEIGKFVAESDREYDQHLFHLMHRFVDPVRRMTRRQSGSDQRRLKDRVMTILKSRERLGREPEDLRRGLIVPHFPISEPLELYADFAVRNGALSLINSIDFRVSRSKLRQKHDEACSIAISFGAADKSLEEVKQKIVIYADDPDAGLEVTPHLKLLGLSADRVVNLRSDSDTLSFVREMEAAADHHSSN